MFRKFLIIACAMLIVSGCASKGKFVYQPSFKSIESDSGKKVVLLAQITDGRNTPWTFDVNYDGDLINDMQLILQDELLRTNLFNKVLMATESVQDIKADVLIEPTLMKLEWKVPGYKALVDRMFYVSFLTGAIGGLISGF